MALTKAEQQELAEIEGQIAQMEQFESGRQKSKGKFKEVQDEIIGEDPELLKAMGHGLRKGGTLSYHDEFLPDEEREAMLAEEARLSAKHPVAFGATEMAGSAPYYAAAAMGGPAGTAALSALHGAGSGSDPIERAMGAVISGLSGGVTHWLGGKLKKGYEDPSKIKAGALGSSKSDWERVGTRNIHTASQNIDKAGGYSMTGRAFDFEKENFVRAHFQGKGIGRKSTTQDYIKRFETAARDIHTGVRKLLRKDPTISKIRVTPDEVLSEPVFIEKLRENLDILDTDENIENAIQSQLSIFKDRLMKRVDGRGELSLDAIYDEKIRWQKQVSKTYSKTEKALSVPETNAKEIQEAIARGTKDYVEHISDRSILALREAVDEGLVPESLYKESVKNFDKISRVNTISSSLRTATEAAKSEVAKQSTRAGKTEGYLPYGQTGLPNWVASMLDLNSPRALMKRSGEGALGAMGKSLGERPLLKGALQTPMRQFPAMESRRLMIEGDPMSLEALPSEEEEPMQSMPPQSRVMPKSIPEALMEQKLPRSTEALMENPNLFLAKVAQQTDNMDLVVQFEEALSSPRKMQKIMPLIAKQYPHLFEEDEYNAWDKKLIDPIDKQNYTKDIQARALNGDINQYQVSEIVDTLNRTGEMLV